MKLSIMLDDEEIVTEIDGTDVKELLSLYEYLGKEICKTYEFDYSKLLEIMIKRELQK
ncbi:hypothetical protein [Cetobacterium sp. 2G large]|uniref:hypothetical protein n=1 Tax=Cetobacterium sp. 2G large TaxID=2759680 RepID=UPI00163C13FB|nr:hypothetical protein [Cetobacterium sp. 2G large]MBC2854530.1 hypothetical protein [Cetobacterium sp. 2G large]